ncbi:tetratricopeptide repeat protein [Pontibacter diazotrophicus]|uniref:Tetratricopeptide repeat protein n=1 Tax=Pontibacter diazotrophicus TaxID=1400979 RepID=A0A3D8LAA9_9BACT|nr:J domain-containing protein [Pontibacter diazotrophicus]RDV14320.1 tetratricopeptide repeat protein [Pontibacter diazotrophicus]
MEYNLYNVLGIRPEASLQEVKGAYKRLALKYHPDRNPGNARAEELFKLVNSAYQTLSNPSKRARYDMRLQFQRQQQRSVVQYQQRYEDPRYAHSRPPAGVSERHYRNIKRDDNRFSRKDWYITFAFVAGLLFFSLLLKVAMDHITGEDKYKTALTYIEDGKYSSAHRLLTDAIQFMPENAAAYEARARIELNVFDNYSSALRDLNRVIALREQPSAQVYYMRGRSYQQLKQHEQAEYDFTLALELDSTFWRVYLVRGEVRLFYLKKYEPAIADLSVYLENTSNSSDVVSALTYRGFGHYKLGNYDLSEQDYRRALAMDKDNGRIYYLLGRTELEQQPDSACAHLSKAYQLGYSAALLELEANCQD